MSLVINKKLLILKMSAMSILWISIAFFVFYKMHKFSNFKSIGFGYWTEYPLNLGKEMTDCENDAVSKYKSYIKNVTDGSVSGGFGEKIAKKHQIYSQKAREFYDKNGKIDIRSIYSRSDLTYGAFESYPFFAGHVKKQRSNFIKTLTRDERKCVRSGLRKISLKEKLEIGDYIFFI